MTSDVIAFLAAQAMGMQAAGLPQFRLEDYPDVEPHFAPAPEDVGEPWMGEDPDLWLYRERTVALLRRYMRLSVETGRLPSLLGREFFRSRACSYHMATFEDAVILVHDVERSLEKLGRLEQKLIAKIVLQEYSRQEVANLLGCALRTVGRRYREALDQLSEIFLEGGLLTRLPAPPTQETCQEGETVENPASDCIDYKNIF